MTRKRTTAAIAAALAVLIAAGVTLLVRTTVLKPTTITAYFASATAIYPGDEVRVSGVKVGTVKTIE
ncbi:MAG: MlaD family protein, partial [Mycobacterium sp.]